MVAVMRLPVGPDPGILPGQALELYLASCCVPVRDVGGEVGLTEGELELGDIGTQFLPGAIGLEVATADVLEVLPHASRCPLPTVRRLLGDHALPRVRAVPSTP